MPLIIEDDVWRTSATPAGGTLDGRKTELFLHHTAGANRVYTRRQECQHMRDLWHLHVKGNGWSDIAYHYVCFPSSRIYRGRPAKTIPAAQENHNTGTRACVVAGTNPVLSLFQRRKLRKLVRKLKEDQGFTKLGGHRDVVATECPGDRIYGWVKKWRTDFGMGKP